MKRSRPTEITEAPEHRSIPLGQVEIRGSADSDDLILTGYASTFEPYEMYGGPALGGWIEQLDRAAFDKTLREGPDLHLLINHEGMPLARTKSGTLKLSADERGLKVTAHLDRSDPDVQRLEAKMRRGDMDEMSFAFRVKAQSWSAAHGFEDDDQSLRTIREVSLHKGDVSVVNFGANPTTSSELKSVTDALEMLTNAEFCELRSDDGLLARARDAIDAAMRGVEDSEPTDEAGKGMSLRAALAAQGYASDDGTRLSVADALAQLNS